MLENLNELVAKVAACRAKAQEAGDQVKVLRDRLNASPEHLALVAAQAELAEAEEGLRKAALETFNATGSKHPHDAVAIKTMRTLTYDVGKALEWAKANRPDLLALDTKGFTKAVAGLALLPEGVAYIEVPTPYVDGDLTPYLVPQADAQAELDAIRDRGRKAAAALFGEAG